MREVLTNNLGLKLTALILAVAIELYFISPQNLITQTIKASVSVRNLPAKRMIVSPRGFDDGYVVDVRIRGPIPLLQQLQNAVYKFTIDVPPNGGDSLSFRFDGKTLGLPPGVEVLDVSPPKLDLVLEPLISKSLVVKVQTTGELPPGYILESKRVTPDTVIVRGPMTALRGLHDVETQPIDISRFTEKTEVEVPLIERSSSLSLEVNVVNAEFLVIPKADQRTLSRVRVTVKGQAAGSFALETPTVKVILNGPAKRLAEIKEEEVEAVIDATALDTGRHELPVSVTSPPGVGVERVTPEAVAVVVARPAPSQSKGGRESTTQGE